VADHVRVFVGFADVVEVDVGELLVGGSFCGGC
jgi:hypothetical protein